MPMRNSIVIIVGLLLLSALHATAQSSKNDPVVLAEEGSAALDERRFGDALDAFTKAAAAVPRDPSLSLGAGLAAFMLGQNDDAQTWFERSLKLNPRYVAASIWLGELHYRAGRVKEAIAVYEAALKVSPEAQEFEDRLAEWRKETQLHDRFYESRGAHFVVLFEGPADDGLARGVVERLEAAYWRIGSTLTTYPPQPITVVLYTREQFRDITRAPAWSAGAYDGRIRVPIKGALDQADELDRVLAHEFVHAVVAMLGGRSVPVWLNEGLATALQPGGLEESAEILNRTTVRPPLQRLHSSFSGLAAGEASVAYAVSAHAVQRMIELRGASAVVALLQDLGRGGSFASSFHQRIAMRYEDFQALVARD